MPDQKIHLEDCIDGMDSIKQLVLAVTNHHLSGTPIMYRLFEFRGITESRLRARGKNAVRLMEKGGTDILPRFKVMSGGRKTSHYHPINPTAHEIYIGRENVLEGLRKHQERLGNPEAILDYYESGKYLESREAV